MSIYDNKKELLDLLSLKENFLYGDFSSKFSQKTIKKKSGGERTINPPNKKLKIAQRAILDKILKEKKYLPCVYGLNSARNILENARQHQKNSDQFVLLLDIQDFFPSVPYKQVIQCYKRMGFSDENSKLLTKLSTFNKYLPQGSPSSCHLASFCLEDIDKKIHKYCLPRKLTYTRYIDDITISGNKITGKDIENLTNILLAGGYLMNDKKILLSPLDQKVINNLLVLKDKIVVPEKYKEEIVLAYKDFKTMGTPQSYARFLGKLGFYIFVNKSEAHAFFIKLK